MANPIVQIEHGKLRGICEESVNGMVFVAFRGIPYAKPPVGELRFKDSEPPQPWTGVRDATKYGEKCAQQDWFSRRYVGSDDCLNLNVYTSSLNAPIPKAVMVWIHSGSFIYGSNKDDLYGPDYLIDKGIVLVIINYRLGILGFLNAEVEEAPGNQGLKDQVLALKWVQRNIKEFGGDPTNVTICGDSAGGAAVHYLTLSPLAQGLFHKAIIQSGVAINFWAYSQAEPMESVKKLAAELNQDVADIKEFIKYLQTLDSHYLIETAMKIETKQENIHHVHLFVPSVDSKAKNPFMPIPVTEAAEAGIRVPCICGYNSHEGIIAVGDLSTELRKAIEDHPDDLLIHPTMIKFLKENNLTVDDIKRFYFGNDEISFKNMDKMIALAGDVKFVMALHHAVRIQSQYLEFPMYLYKFEFEVEESLIKKFLSMNVKGTCHGEEMSFLFHQKIGKLVKKKIPKSGSMEYLLIQRFTGLWANFAKTGNPTPQPTYQLPVEWEPIDASNEFKLLHITRKLDMTTEKNIITEIRDKIKS